MPVKSKKQWKFLAVNHPEVLHSWQKETPKSFSRLPIKAKKAKPKGK